MSSVFSQIMQGQLPGHFVYQDEIAIAIMTIQPVQPGHVLVIPRQEIDHFDDLPGDVAAHLMQLSQRVTKAIKQAYPCLRVSLVIAGLEVPHTHIHLIPINRLEDISFQNLAFAESDDLAAAAAKIAAHL